MRLHSPQFEKALRRSVRQAVKRSRELKREFRAAKKLRRRYPAALLVRPVMSVVFATMVWQIAEKTGHPASALAAINLWAFGFIFIQAQRLISHLYTSADLPVFALLPVTEATIFRWERQKFFRGALWFGLDLLGGYAALALCYNFPWTKWFAVIPVSLVAWVQVLALAALCVVYLPRLPYQLASGGLLLVVIVLFMARDLVASPVLAFLDHSAPSVNLLLPTGWPASLFQILLPDGQWIFLGLLVPTGATIWTLRNSSARLQANYRFNEPIWREPPDLVPGTDEDGGMAAGLDPDQLPRVGPTAVEEMVRSRLFLAAPSWHQRGWFESWLWRWLSARERALAEFVFPNGLSIAAPWKRIARHLALFCVAAIAAGLVSPTAEYGIVGAGLFVTGCQVLAQVLATGRAFQSVGCRGVNIPLYAGYPIGFRELARLLFKCSLVQVPLLIPFAVASRILVFFLADLSITDGALFGVKAGGLILVSRFFFITFAFSSGTNDTSSVRLRSVALLGFVVICALGFMGLGAASLFVPYPSAAWILWGLAALDAYVFYRVYGWFYHANRFDLMSLPRR